MLKIKCQNCLPNKPCKPCKSLYDKVRRKKIKNGKWIFNKPTPNKLNSEQEQVLIGGLLGDFYLYRNKNHVNAGISCGRATKDKKYLEYQFNLYKDFCSDAGITDSIHQFGGPARVSLKNKILYSSTFRTRVCKVFTPFKDKWYPKGKKIVPKDLILTPLICAIWFCDDGCVIRLKNKFKKDRLRLQLSTDGFKKKEVLFLKKLLENEIGGIFHVSHKRNNQFYVRAENDATVNFIKYIEKFIPKSMKRKSDKWKGLI